MQTYSNIACAFRRIKQPTPILISPIEKMRDNRKTKAGIVRSKIPKPIWALIVLKNIMCSLRIFSVFVDFMVLKKDDKNLKIIVVLRKLPHSNNPHRTRKKYRIYENYQPDININSSQWKWYDHIKNCKISIIFWKHHNVMFLDIFECNVAWSQLEGDLLTGKAYEQRGNNEDPIIKYMAGKENEYGPFWLADKFL